MSKNKKNSKNKRKPRFAFQCKVDGCGRRVNTLVSDPRYPMRYMRHCCEKCAKEFKEIKKRRQENDPSLHKRKNGPFMD